MSFLKIGDRAAGAIKSGGTTRRAAKMVTLDLDHPDIEEFVNWKVVEEKKVAALVAGSRMLDRHLNAVITATADGDVDGDERFVARTNPALGAGHARGARRPACPTTTSSARSSSPARASRELHIDEYDTDWHSEAYYTVSGQNTNNSVRVTNDFMHAVEEDDDWHLYGRTERRARPSRPAARRSRARRCGPATCGTRSPTPPGPAPTPACSSTTPPTSGTPARPTARSAPRTRAPSTCSSTTRPATWRR